MKIFLLALMSLITLRGNAQARTDTIKVYGNCGMCENRIEKALKIEGVIKADWDMDSKLLVVSYNPAVISNKAIQKAVAAVGHDTEKYSADKKVYNKLPGCCLYERKKVRE